MVDWLSIRILFLRSSLMDLAWLFLNIKFLFRDSNASCGTTPVGAFTPGALTESSGSVLDFLGPLNDVRLLWNWKWLFPLLSSLSELVRMDYSSPNSSMLASNVVKVFFVFLFSLSISDLLDLLGWIAQGILSLILFFLSSFLLRYGQLDAGWPSFSHLNFFCLLVILS